MPTETLSAVAEAPALEAPPQTEAAKPGTGWRPAVPKTVEEAGLTVALVEQLLLKLLYGRGEMSGRDLAGALGLNYSVIEPVIEFFKRRRLIEARRSLGMGDVSTLFGISEAGRSHARQHLEASQYAGVAPVPIAQYWDGVQAQKLKDGWLTREALAAAYSHMVVSAHTLAQVGPAVNSNKSLLIYGQPGNGKTYMAEALFNIQSEPIYVPYAIECQGQVVQVYDPVYHQKLDDGDEDGAFVKKASYDRRWFRCRRPFIVTGGELTLPMLDLSYNATANVYDAPFHLKANNGIYLIDDFGRQRVTPAEVLNRWIVPMERRVDYLSFHTGGKVSVPFECFLVFSTNLRPDQLGDEAFLRRIQYKMLVRSPDEREFAEIFGKHCVQKRLPCTPQVFGRFLDRRYRKTGKPFRRCHPRDVIGHAIDLIHFERLPYQMTDDLLDRAYESCFVDSQEME